MRIWEVDRESSQELLEQALQAPAAILREGGLVAFPTETVYGLGADATNEQAVQGIFAAKKRPADNPLIVHIATMDMLAQVTPDPASLPEPAKRAMALFWPGPLTLIVPAHPALAPSVRPGMETVGVRMPNHPVAHALIATSGVPIAAPSANQSGKPSPTRASDVLEDLGDTIDGVVNGGACDVGVESTVVAIRHDAIHLYRPGGVTKEQLESALGLPVLVETHDVTGEVKPKSPGMKYRHYAPNASVHVWFGNEQTAEAAMIDFLQAHPNNVIGVVAPATGLSNLTNVAVHRANVTIWRAPLNVPYPDALSQALYGLLRDFDHAGTTHILILGTEPVGMGAAVMNRLSKAAEGRVHRV